MAHPEYDAHPIVKGMTWSVVAIAALALLSECSPDARGDTNISNAPSEPSLTETFSLKELTESCRALTDNVSEASNVIKAPVLQVDGTTFVACDNVNSLSIR